MPFISFAQNLEDVVLYRALSDVTHGFYVDVGANSPDEQSVTRAFYERGWRGINIEPALGFHDQLIAARPHDVNLAVAAGDSVGTVTFYDIPGSELSTGSAELARRHHYAGLTSTERQVPQDTLDNIFEAHGVTVVHFLKIDVEGMEAAVLRGLSLRTIRPWIILVEATVARTQIPNHQEWEFLLTDRSYRFVHFDGLNRFYVAEEKAELIPSLEIQPNIFDDWFRAHDWVAREQAAALRKQAADDRVWIDSERDLRRVEAETRNAEIGIRALESEIRTQEQEVRASEAEARAAEAEIRAREIDARDSEIRVRTAEAVVRSDEVVVRSDEVAARQSEGSLRHQEIEVRQEEADLRQREAELRRDELRVRDQEIAQRQAELASRDAERAAWRADVDARLAEWQRVAHENARLHQHIAAQDAVIASLNGYIDAVRVSVSWRLTAPVRKVKRTIVSARSMTVKTLAGQVRPLAVRIARKMARWAAARPLIKKGLVPILLRHPALERKARALLARPAFTLQAVAPQPQADMTAEPVPVAAVVCEGTLVARPMSATERNFEATLRRARARTR
ncbi:MAG TPA: FkbM family methyltransferase [Skermanella sp.]|jgi:FkbM family methyltransferase|nr:FkbM family methyltransferase [Skermanella sp.]